jgi:hypothetical protein
MQPLPAPLAQALDRLDDAVDCSAALAALMFTEHDLDEAERLHVGTLIRTLARYMQRCEQPEGDLPSPSIEQVQLCFEGLAALMDPVTPLDKQGRSTVFTLLVTVSELQRECLNGYAHSVQLHMQPVPVEALANTAAPPRRTKKAAQAA